MIKISYLDLIKITTTMFQFIDLLQGTPYGATYPEAVITNKNRVEFTDKDNDQYKLILQDFSDMYTHKKSAKETRINLTPIDLFQIRKIIDEFLDHRKIPVIDTAIRISFRREKHFFVFTLNDKRMGGIFNMRENAWNQCCIKKKA